MLPPAVDEGRVARNASSSTWTFKSGRVVSLAAAASASTNSCSRPSAVPTYSEAIQRRSLAVPMPSYQIKRKLAVIFDGSTCH